MPDSHSVIPDTEYSSAVTAVLHGIRSGSMAQADNNETAIESWRDGGPINP